MGKKPSPGLRRAMETNNAVERILASTTRLSAHLGGIPQASENVRRLRRGEPAQWNRSFIQQVGVDSMLNVSDHVSRSAVVELWRQQGRRAYDIHPEMAAQLYRADLKGKLPGGLFARLPHISPMVPLPRPWPFRSNNGTRGLIRAYFLTGRVGREAFCPTTDKRSEGLAVMPWVEWEDSRGSEWYEDVATPLFVLPSTDDPFSLDDIIDHPNTWHGTHSDGDEMEMVRQILPGLVSVMTYLCCDNRDMEKPAPPPTPKGKKPQAPSRDPFYIRVGWHVGPALHANRVRAQQAQTRDRGGASEPTGVEYGPQHRVGHYKSVPHGPQRALRSVRWIDPYWTKRELLDEDQEPGTGIIPVNPQQRDPSNHRDVRSANLGNQKSKEIRDREAQRRREEDMDW